MTNTIPATLTAALATQGALPDPTTGLALRDLGGGQWYDPSLGRPLQPNSLGGPPSVPQALNRYAATSMGPPGVAAGVASSDTLFSNVAQSIVSNSFGMAISESGLSPFANNLVNKVPWYSLTARRIPGYTRPAYLRPQRVRTVKRSLAALLGDDLVAQDLAKGRMLEWSGVVRLNSSLVRHLSRRGFSFTGGSVARRIWTAGPRYLTLGDFVPGIGADLVVGALWQAFLDGELWTTNPGLAFARSSHTASVNAINGVIGYATVRGSIWVGGRVAVALGILVNFPEPSDLIVTPLVLLTTVTIDIFAGDRIGNTLLNLVGSESLDMPRNLKPLN